MPKRDWPNKYEYLGFLPPSSQEQAGVVFDSLLWSVGDAPCYAIDRVREALEGPGGPDITGARLSLEAGIRTVHSGGDLVAQLVDASALVSGVKQRSVGLNQPKFLEALRRDQPAIGKVVDAFLHTPEWRYVSDVTNCLKHTKVLPMMFEGTSVSIMAFEHRSARYSDRELNDVARDVVRVQEGLWDIFWEAYQAVRGAAQG